MACMQASVPELTDFAAESQRRSNYTAGRKTWRSPTPYCSPGMVERGPPSRSTSNWDTHSNVAGGFPNQCRDIDQACYGLIQDLKARPIPIDAGIWGGEFGSTIYSQGGLTKKRTTAATIIRLLHHVWSAAQQRRHSSTARPTTLLQHHQGPRASATSATVHLGYNH